MKMSADHQLLGEPLENFIGPAERDCAVPAKGSVGKWRGTCRVSPWERLNLADSILPQHPMLSITSFINVLQTSSASL